MGTGRRKDKKQKERQEKNNLGPLGLGKALAPHGAGDLGEGKQEPRLQAMPSVDAGSSLLGCMGNGSEARMCMQYMTHDTDGVSA